MKCSGPEVGGVPRQAVQKWESGASRPDMDNLAALARYFGVTLDHLVLGGRAPSAPPPVDWFSGASTITQPGGKVHRAGRRGSPSISTRSFF